MVEMARGGGQRLLRLGDRALFIGGTGSGKTVAMALMLDRLYGQRQIIVLNSKDDPVYARWGGLRVTRLRDLRGATWPEIPLAIYTPATAERRNPAYADALCQWIWERRHTVFAVDELRQLAPGAIPMPGYADLLERSRGPRDITVAQGTQRPVFIPHSAYSEASVFFVFRLSDRRDRATVAAFAHESIAQPVRHPHGFWSYRAGDMAATYWRDIRDLLAAQEDAYTTPGIIAKPTKSAAPSAIGGA